MKIETIRCDICGVEIISADPLYIIKTDQGNKMKQVGCDIVLTPRGNRLYGMGGKAIIRVNASFYCGYHPDNTEELHCHRHCLQKAVQERIVAFYQGTIFEAPTCYDRQPPDNSVHTLFFKHSGLTASDIKLIGTREQWNMMCDLDTTSAVGMACSALIEKAVILKRAMADVQHDPVDWYAVYRQMLVYMFG
jgi:hypothetical protein